MAKWKYQLNQITFLKYLNRWVFKSGPLQGATTRVNNVFDAKYKKVELNEAMKKKIKTQEPKNVGIDINR